LPKIEIRGTELNRIIEAEVKYALREWLKVILQKWPSYTGTMRGSLQPLSRILNMMIPRLAEPGAGIKKFFEYRGRKYPLGWSQGKTYGQAELNRSHTKYELRYKFTYSNTLPYTLWNETMTAPFPLKVPTPYNITPVAARAFFEHIGVKVPKLLRKAVSIKVTELRTH
jgi:hypothetical protein